MDMNFKYGSIMKYIGVFLILILVGCVSSPPYPKAKINGKYEILGAKIYSPNELGWYLIQHSQNSITFGTIPTSTDSVIANINLFWVGEFDKDNDFLESIIAERYKNNDKERWFNRVVENNFITFKGNSCFSYKTVAEDHQSKSKSRKSFQYYNTIGNICRHPANKNTAIQVEVSYRADSKEIPIAIKAIAERFINNLELLGDEIG
jgi:hypothetical protein